jgi:nucleotide-binding universal stress UspA family protein
MFWAKRILVPIDFSPCSQLALRYALTLSQRFGSTVDVVHVKEHVGDEAAAAINDLINENVGAALRDEFGDVRFQLVSGSPAETIVRLALNGHYDLIAIGQYGSSGRSIGRVTRDVSHLAPCHVVPVWEPASNASNFLN